ncbi:MAG: histidine triad nucleotide-binding protein [Deltaproteobacteria bacterium]|nr:histidine triad nucleotide-binding protein [Deltaproteobacteria bacterium]
MGCLFCNILEKKIPADVVYEDEHALAFRDIRPVAPTHVLVIPRKHIAAVHEVGDDDDAIMGKVVLAARNVARKLGLEANGYRLVVNDGDQAGQTVHHLHVHVLGGRNMSWPPG